MVILEGPDCAGKSTFISNLGVDAAHHGPYLDKDGKFLFETYIKDLVNPDVVACDRSWPSEFVYGSIIRNNIRLERTHSLMLQRVALGMNAKMVFCLPPMKNILETYVGRHEEEYVKNEDRLISVVSQYRKTYEAFKISGFPCTSYDYTSDPQPPKVDVTSSKPTFGIGKRSGNPILIIGERANDSLDLPFVTFRKKGCSHWLTDQINGNGISETHLCWANAENRRGSSNYQAIKDLIDEVEPLAICALGKTARELASWFDHSNVVGFEHPEYHRRFKSKTVYPLITYLKGVINGSV